MLLGESRVWDEHHRAIEKNEYIPTDSESIRGTRSENRQRGKLAFLELRELYSNGRPKNPLNKNAIKPAVMSLIIGISYIIRIGVFSAKIQRYSTKR